jgi:putative transposase
VIPLGIGIDGIKHPLSLVEGSKENTTLLPTRRVERRRSG